MDAGRLELYDLLKPALGDEPARKLVLALPPQPEELATRAGLERLEAANNAGHEMIIARVDARFGQMEAALTRRMVAIMGAWTVTVASLFAWVSAFFG